MKTLPGGDTHSQSETSASVVLVLRVVGKAEETDKLAVDENGKVVEEAEVGVPSPAVHHTPAVAATTCSSQWRRDARVLGSPPFNALGSLGPLPLCAMPTLV